MVTLTHYYDSIRLNISQGDPVGHWCAAFNIEVRINCEKFKVMNKSVWVCVCVCVCFHMWWFFLRWQQVWDHSDPSLKGQYVITSKCDRASNSLPILCAINILTCKTLICSDSGEMRRASPRLWKNQSSYGLTCDMFSSSSSTRSRAAFLVSASSRRAPTSNTLSKYAWIWTCSLSLSVCFSFWKTCKQIKRYYEGKTKISCFSLVHGMSSC